MTDYVGEILRLWLDAPVDFNGDVMTDADGTVFVTVTNAAGDTILDDRQLAYSADETLWYYLWVTTEDENPVRLGGTRLPGGTYTAWFTLVDSDNHESEEKKRIRLRRRA